MTASHTQLTLIQQNSTRQNSRQQSLDQPAFQEATASSQGKAGQPSSDVNSMRAPPSAPLPPAAFPTNQYSNAGETQAMPGLSGRSDMSQALMFNTAGLEHNLAAAQRGDAVDVTEAGDLDADIETDSSSTAVSRLPTRTASINTASGA